MADALGAQLDLTAFNAAMARLAAGVPDAANDAAADTAVEVAARARTALPHRSGRLAASVHVDRERDGATVAVGTAYAGWVEYGGTRGRPYVAGGRYVGPSARGSERAMAARAARNVERVRL